MTGFHPHMQALRWVIAPERTVAVKNAANHTHLSRQPAARSEYVGNSSWSIIGRNDSTTGRVRRGAGPAAHDVRIPDTRRRARFCSVSGVIWAGRSAVLSEHGVTSFLNTVS